MAQLSDTAGDAQQTAIASKKAESIRSYCFLDEKSFLLVTNSGKLLVESFVSEKKHSLQSSLVRSTVIDQIEELAGYSTCTSVPAHGVAFVAGNKGNMYMYSKDGSTLRSIHRVTGKVGSLFVSVVGTVEGRTHFALLATLVGKKQAHLLRIDPASSSSPESIQPIIVPVSETLTGSIVTSMERVAIGPNKSVLILGFRRGAIALYSVLEDTANLKASLFRIVEKAHGDETVTAMKWLSSADNTSEGHLYSVGRDGCLAVHSINLTNNIVQLVHNLSLPIGPNIENIYLHENRLMANGFSSKKWVLYDVESEEEIMGIETGGAHRSWAFQPRLDAQGGGTLVWTRTSSLHICSQEGSNHGVLRSGGHGREIKAVAVSPRLGASGDCLVATGAEDTDIKIFQYTDGEPVCKRTLRRHTTGIQHLQWSDDGKYLFSSAGSEEFYIWRVRTELAVVDVGVVCEHVYIPESEFSDLRIMSFDVTKRDTAYLIAMVFSDSSVKVSTDPCPTITSLTVSRHIAMM
ncbi:WD repeat-containing protein 6 [Neodidymelliopsis sp. IMI 364377]|nr:WD repeat-containing protein 6 [Neodidymelliopsis sp. IMI 364377]